MSGIKTDVKFVPDFDTSSMRGFSPGMTEAEVSALLNGGQKKEPEAPKAYDVDSSSMRGFTSGGQPVAKL